MFNKKIRFLSSLLLIITVFSSSTFNAQAAVSNFNDGITIGLGNTTLGTGLLLDVDGNIGANSFCDANGANCTAAAGIGGKWLDGVGANEIYYSAANVGIGISNPAAPLHLSNNSATLRIDDANDASATADTVIRMYDNASAQMSWLGRTNNILYFRNVNGDDIRMGTSNSDDLTIEPSGEVGIGTTTPVEELHVFTSQANPTTIIAGNTSTSTNTNTRAGFTAAANGGQLDIYHSGSAATGSVGDQTKADAAVIKTLTGSPSSKMVIGTGGAVPLNFMTNDLTRMTILANGNVGIGKTNPGTALDMTGQIRTTSHIEAGNGTGGVAMTVNDGYGNANLTFNHVSGVPDITGNAARIEVNTDSTTNAQMFFELGSGLTTGVAAGLTSVMRLGADGRVGIGTTSPSARVHIVSGADSNLLLSGGSKDLSVPNGEVLQIGHLDTTTNAFTERMQIAVSGNVGIGSTSPTETLVVRDVSVADDRRGIRNIAYRPHITLEDLSTSANDWQIWADSGDLSFLYGDASDGVSKLGSTAMVMDASNGNIGFGTAAPSEVLHINSINPSIRMVDTNTGADAFITANSGVGGVAIQADLNSEVVGSYIDLSVDGATRVRVTETGDVGIGDTTPDGSLKLDVNGNIGANNYCDGAGNNCIAATALGDGDNLGNHTATTNLDMNDRDIRNTRIIQGKDLDDDTGGTDNKYRMFYRDGAHTFYDGGVVIGRYGNGTWTDLANGNLIIQNQVGVGFTNPSEEVHVRRDQLSPTTVAVQNASAGADTDVSAGFTAQSNGTSLRIETYGTGATGTLGGANRADAAFMRTASGAPASSLNIGNGGAAPLNFFTTDLTRMTILANGNVGIGTTSPGANLHIDASNPTVRISGDSTGAWGGSSLYMEALGSTAANRFNQALFSMTRGSAGDASFSLQRRDDNAFTGTIMGYGDTTGLSFGTAVNNTAAATTERIKILPNGNVGISETNPAFRLDVNGSFAADYLGRRTHSSGHLVGGYNNLGANSTNTNPIFTIGTNYNPTDTTLGNMYGIGYTSGGSASFITGTGNGWGMYIASDGDARTFLSGASSNSYINKDGGNVGIGTDSPSHRLHVASSARIPEVIFAPNNNGAADKSSIVGGSGAVQIFADANIDFYESDSNTREFRFNMGNGNFEFSGNLRRITGSGNLKCPTGEVMVGFSETGIMCEEPTIIYN